MGISRVWNRSYGVRTYLARTDYATNNAREGRVTGMDRNFADVRKRMRFPC